MKFKKAINLSGWLSFLISAVVLTLTVEPTTSFWDCGEFIAVSNKLMVPHPPGAPFYLLISRIFSMFAPDETQVAFMVNMVSVLSSAFTVMFLNWAIILLALKLFIPKNAKKQYKNVLEQPEQLEGENEKTQLSWADKLLVLGSGFVGAMAFAFTDTFWFSATEAEVYALSIFFTAFVFWAILRWEQIDDNQIANRWLLLIAFMMGLSIGVHLLNLVSIPALGLVYYFKKYSPDTKGIVATLLISAGIILIILSGIIPGLPTVAGNFEVVFVNSFGLPFGAGIIVFSILFLAAIIFGIRYTYTSKQNDKNIALGAVALLSVGFLFFEIHGGKTFFVRLVILAILGGAVYYLNKKKSLLNLALLAFTFIMIGYSSYGIAVIRSNFDPPIDENDPENIIKFVSYLKREQYGTRPLFNGPVFNSNPVKKVTGPPVYRKGDDNYVAYSTKDEYEYDYNVLLPRAYDTRGDRVKRYKEIMDLREGERPNLSDNIKFMFSYQMGHMYWRYFGWNFVGRVSDVQGAGVATPFDEYAPHVKNNAAHNHYYFLPLILGLLGAFYHFRKNLVDASVVGALFFFTGLAIILYLNQPTNEPRERDYTSVGSFYVFCIWIGLGVFAVADILKNLFKKEVVRNAVAILLCFSVPGILIAENWDDHDRSGRYYARDSAKNLLASCAENAILFTGGDNDTFPLWYVQNVEGFRTDVRVVVLSYLTADWYIAQLKQQAYESDPLPISLEEDEFLSGTNDYLPLQEKSKFKNGVNAKAMMKAVKSNAKAIQGRLPDGTFGNTLPTKRFILPVDKETIRKNKVVSEDQMNEVVDNFVLDLNGNGVIKNDLMILDIIANNNWERPIYFNNTSIATSKWNVRPYMKMEGLTYRLVPVRGQNRNSNIDTDIMYENMMENFYYNGLSTPGVYHDDENRKFVQNTRSSFLQLAGTLIEEGKKEKAKKAISFCLESMPDETVPFDFIVPMFVNFMLQLDMDDKADEVSQLLMNRAVENLNYYYNKGGRDQSYIREQLSYVMRPIKDAYLQHRKEDELTKSYKEDFETMVQKFGGR